MAEKEIGIIFDLEANGLYQDATRIHCIAYYDSAANETFSFNDECPGKGMSSPITTALSYMAQADYLIGHNIIGYDIPLIRKLYSWFSGSGLSVLKKRWIPLSMQRPTLSTAWAKKMMKPP